MAGFSVNVRSNVDVLTMELLASARDMRDQATVRALNKMGDQVKVAAARSVRDAGYNLKIGDIKKALKVVKATQGNLRATVVASGKPIPLILYGARATAKGVTVSVLKGRKVIAGAFIATMPGGHKGVFVREPNARHKKVARGGKPAWNALPIRELYGPSIPDGMANAAVQEALMALIADKFPGILEHEHEWLRRKLGR
jgi:hypothetical protein